MVGEKQGSMKTQKKKLRMAEMTSGLVGAKYSLGNGSFSNGYDCVSLLLDVAKKRNLPVPDVFEGITRETYSALWNTNKPRAKATLFRFLASLGEKIKPKFAFTGDLLILKNKETGELTIGIHAGGDKVLSAFTDAGVALASLQAYTIKQAYRWGK